MLKTMSKLEGLKGLKELILVWILYLKYLGLFPSPSLHLRILAVKQYILLALSITGISNV